jgi:hypothetical protein
MVNMKKKITKILILISFCMLIATGILMFFKINQKENLEGNNEILFNIANINPDQILWYEESLLVKKDNFVKKLNLEERNLESFFELEENEILAIYKNELVLMNYKNHIITSLEQNASDISIYNMEREEIFSKSFHETVKPLYIENEFLFLMDNYLNSPERTYRVDLKNGEIELFEIEEQLILQGDENVEIFDRKNHLLFKIPKMNDITSFSVNENFNKIALLDMQGNVWIYLKNPDN